MKILGVDSTATAASVSVLEDEKILSQVFSNTGLTHSQTLMPMVDDALKIAKLNVSDIDYFAVSDGPGSFTGVRIGVAAVKGISQPLNKECVCVSTLETIAKPLENSGCLAVAVMDARCNQVYTAQFDCSEGFKRVTADEAISITDLAEKLKDIKNQNIVLIGDGTNVAYKGLKDIVCNIKKAPLNIRYQAASSVSLIAYEKLINDAENSAVKPEAVLPNYLRLSQAERELKKKNK